MDYTHYLVTKGRRPDTQRRPDHLLPLSLTPIADGLRAAQTAAEASLRRCAFAVTIGQPTSFQTIVALSSPWIVRALGDLWLSQVRQVARGVSGTPDEETIEWVLLDDPPGILPPVWQGPADAVIPRACPVTLRWQGSETRFEVELTA